MKENAYKVHITGLFPLTHGTGSIRNTEYCISSSEGNVLILRSVLTSAVRRCLFVYMILIVLAPPADLRLDLPGGQRGRTKN
jgi:hypothetical protein